MITPAVADMLNELSEKSQPAGPAIQELQTVLDSTAACLWSWKPGTDRGEVLLAAVQLLQACAGVIGEVIS